MICFGLVLLGDVRPAPVLQRKLPVAAGGKAMKASVDLLSHRAFERSAPRRANPPATRHPSVFWLARAFNWLDGFPWSPQNACTALDINELL